jgi:hypothetical protein
MAKWEPEFGYFELDVSVSPVAVQLESCCLYANVCYRWLYLVFFNTLWVFLPIYSLYEAYGSLTRTSNTVAKSKKKA